MKKKKYILRGSTVAALVIATGVVLTYASIPDAKGVIHGCYGKNADANGGNLRVIDTPGGSCRPDESPVSWNQSGPPGPIGPQGPTGPVGPQGPSGTVPTDFNANFQHVTLAASPGVTVSHLSLPPGQYVILAKFRYQNNGTSGTQTGACILQGTGVGGLDASQANVPSGGEFTGQVDGYMMDFVNKQPGSAGDVHLQCIGPPDVQIVNSRLAAYATALQFQ